MDVRWSLLWTLIETRIEPVLAQAGFLRTEAGLTDDDWKNPYFSFERPQDKLGIGIDALDWAIDEQGPNSDLNTVRVEVGGKYLKEHFPSLPFSNEHELVGWKYATDEELRECIDQITDLLKQYFNPL